MRRWLGEIRFLEEQFVAFSKDMLADAPDETVAACAAGWYTGRDGAPRLLYRKANVATDGDYIRRAGAGAVVTPEFLSRTVKHCRDSGDAFILAHTHPFSGHPYFSGIDDGGEDVLMPRVRQRAPNRPHGALVLGTDGGSARVWLPTATSARDVALRRIGARLDVGHSPIEYARQDLALGPGSAASLKRRTVAVIGSGGLGWQIAALLWGHGIGKLVPIDDDVVESHNRPRLPGARAEHDGSLKVDALADVLSPTRDDGEIEPHRSRFSDGAARAAAAEADLIVVATDNLASRLDADHFARRVLVPLIDTGINVQVENDRVHRIGGRVSVSWPLGPCLTCMGVLSPDAVALEVDPVGYRGTGRRQEAAVLGFNAVVAGLAVAEALSLLLPIRTEPRRSRYLAYDGVRGLVREIGVPEPGSCGSCADLAGAVHGRLP